MKKNEEDLNMTNVNSNLNGIPNLNFKFNFFGLFSVNFQAHFKIGIPWANSWVKLMNFGILMSSLCQNEYIYIYIWENKTQMP